MHRRTVSWLVVLSVPFSFAFIASLAGCGGSSKPVVSINTPASNTVDPGDSVTLTATVEHGSGEGVSWTLSGTSCATSLSGSTCGTLSNQTSASVTYTAPSTVTSALSITITATSVKEKSVTATVSLTVPANPAITTALGALTAGQVGSTYTATVAVSGGISPYTWSVTSGNLPTGLMLAASSGTISGTPTASGNYTFTLTVTDSGSPTTLTASGQFSISIAAAPAITFSTTPLPSGTIGTAYSASVTATGGAGALTYAVTSGSLPASLSMASSGAITGTPSAAGTSSFKVTASDAYGDTAAGSFSITINYPQLTVTTSSLPTGYVGTAYASTTLAASGGSNTGYTWTWAAASGSSLPAGLNLSSAGVISGKPTTAGTFSVVVTVKDSASNTANATLSIAVDPAVSVTTTSLPTGYANSPYTATTLAATGGAGTSYTWTWAAATGSSLPAGLSLSGAGVISGTPTTAGAYSVVVTAEDSAKNTGSATLALTVDAGITITTTTLPGGYQGTLYTSTTLAATGGSGTGYSWAWTAASGSSIPPGLSLSSGGLITGTPTTGGTFSVVVTVKDSANNSAQATFAIAIEATLAISTTSPLPSGTLNVAYSQMLAATGGSGTYTWSTTGTNTLSSVGLSFSGGVVSGTPTASGAATFTAVVTDTQSHTAQTTFSVTVYNALTITTTSLPAGGVGTAYSQTLAAAGGTGTSYTWTATGSNLSTYGLSFSSAGVVSGTPSTSGTASFTANVKDSGGNTAQQPLTITIYNALSQSATGLPLTATTGASYSGTIAGAGGSGNYCWTVTGASDGLSASAANASCGFDGNPLTIAGTPSTAETVKITVTVTDTLTNISVSDSYSIVVSPPQPLTLPATNPSSLPAATQNDAYSGSITATGGAGPYTWKINSVPISGTVTLSDGLSATASGATLSVTGTPISTGTVTLASVTITDSESTPVTAGPYTYTITVNPASQISGQISLNLLFICGTIPSLPPVTVTLSDTSGVISTQTTDSNGNYSFSNLANGTYTVTPSISGAESLFFPASYSIAINNNSATGNNFSADIGYTVSGNISYSGTKTGQTYIVIEPSGCPGIDSVPGTSIAEATLTNGGAFTVRGVPPGSWLVYAWMDTLGQGEPNTSNPSGTSNAAFSVTDANVTGATDAMTDPTLAAPTAAPLLKSIAPTDQGVVISFGGGSVSNSEGVEEFTSYTVQWSTSSTSFTGGGSATFQAIGRTANIWIVNNAIKGISGSFTNGTAYYFRARGTNPAGNGPWSYWAGPKVSCSSASCAITVAPGAAGASSGWNEITGTVTIPSSITVNAGAVLYAGYYDQDSNTAYATAIASPSASTPNAYTVYVPSGQDYIQFGILDQNDDGLIDVGDVDNVNNGGEGQATVTISGPLSGQDITLPSSNSNAVVTTSFFQNTYNNSGTPATSSAYSLGLNVTEGDDLPVAVTLASGPNVLQPLDMSSLCLSCGSLQFAYYANTGNTPKVGDAYTFDVTYAENPPGTGTDTAAVTAVLGTGQAASSLAPNPGSASVSTTPTFTWTYPANAANYVYQFQLTDTNGNIIWQIPSQNSNANGFKSTQIAGSLVYGTDPTDSTNVPSLTALAGNTQYQWQITTMDSNGNQATIRTYFMTQ